MRRFLLPLLFASALMLGFIGTGHTIPTTIPIVDPALLAIIGISAVSSVPLFLLGSAMDQHHHEVVGVRKAEKIALRTLKDEQRRKEAEADAAELTRERIAAGDLDDDMVIAVGKTNGAGIHPGYFG